MTGIPGRGLEWRLQGELKMHCGKFIIAAVVALTGLTACGQQDSRPGASAHALLSSSTAMEAGASSTQVERPSHGKLPIKPMQANATSTAFGFKPHRIFQYANGDADFQSVAAADFNGDGRTDLVALSNWYQIDVFMQDANGALGAPHVYRLGGEDYYYTNKILVTGDFNEDGITDVAFHTAGPNGGTDGIGLLLGRKNMAPVFRQGLANGVASSNSLPHDWAALDVDGDGHLDIVKANNEFPYENADECGDFMFTCPRYTVMHGNGHGDFGRIRTIKLGLTLDLVGLETIDLNDDGIGDLVMRMHDPKAATNSGRIMVAYRLEGGGLAAPKALFSTANRTDYLVFGDINGDGIDDAVLGGEVRLRSVNGSFDAPRYLQAANLYPSLPVLADFDGDGRTDLINHQFGDFGAIPYLAVYLQKDNTLQAPFLIQDPPSRFLFKVSTHRRAYAAGDLNGDGCNDLAIAVGLDGISFLEGEHCLQRPRVRPDESRFYRIRRLAPAGP